jgi:hypothetical protein
MSSEQMAPLERFSKRYFSARNLSSLACLEQVGVYLNVWSFGRLQSFVALKIKLGE